MTRVIVLDTGYVGLTTRQHPLSRIVYHPDMPCNAAYVQDDSTRRLTTAS